MANINRRSFLAGLTSVGAVGLAVGDEHTSIKQDIGFIHGVASGDPLQTKVIIWTRVSLKKPAEEQPALSVKWQVAEDAKFEKIVREGLTTTSSLRDYTVKVDVDRLSAAKKYFYRFICNGVISSVGRTRTMPKGNVDQAHLAVVSCSNYGYGYFNVYEELSKQTDLNAVLHLGDYIYEYANEVYSSPELIAKDRSLTPKTEVVELSDYRQRYATYRLDKQLQAAHAAHPFICVWDDHELANDAWQDGAENHQADEGDWAERRSAAIKAYREWLPIRDSENVKQPEITYRRFDIGNLASLIMLDTRLVGRTKAFDYRKDMIWQQIPFDMSHVEKGGIPKVMTDSSGKVDQKYVKMVTVPFDMTQNPPMPMTDWHKIEQLEPNNLPSGYAFLPNAQRMQEDVLNDVTRELLGTKQEQWLEANLRDSSSNGIPWQILGQQILMGKVCVPDITSLLNYEQGLPRSITDAVVGLGKLDLPYNSDAWDGYNVTKQRILQRFKNDANNVISLAGDTHNAWAFNLTPDNEDSPVAVEMATPSVSSPGMENYFSNNDPVELSKRFVDRNPDMVYQNSHQRGWLHLTLKSDECIGQWRFVDTVKSREYSAITGPSYKVKKGQHQLLKS